MYKTESTCIFSILLNIKHASKLTVLVTLNIGKYDIVYSKGRESTI